MIDGISNISCSILYRCTCSASQRHAGALLLMLVLIIILSTSTLFALRNWSHAREQQQYFLNHHQLHRMRSDYAQAIDHWIDLQASELFFPCRNEQQGWLICDDIVHGDGDIYHIRVTVYDALAGIPPSYLAQHTAHAEDLFSSVLPQALHIPQLSQLSQPPKSLAYNPASLWRIALPEGVQRFPQHAIVQKDQAHVRTQWTVLGTQPLDHVSKDKNSVITSISETTQHNAWATWISPYNDGRININTCPQPILAYFAHHYASANGTTNPIDDQLEAFFRQRDTGAVRRVPAFLQAPRTSRSRNSIQFVSTSDSFYSLLTISNGTQNHAWWMVHMDTDDAQTQQIMCIDHNASQSSSFK